MIIVAAKVTAKPGKREAFIKAAQPSIAATRKEDGCLFYTLYASTENETDLLYYEQWTSREALDKHLASAHMKQFGDVKTEQDLVVGDTDVQIHNVV